MDFRLLTSNLSANLIIILLLWYQTEERQGADRGQTTSPKDPPITRTPFGALAELFDRRRRIPEKKALYPKVSRRVPEQTGGFPEQVPNNTARKGVLFPKNSQSAPEEIREKCRRRARVVLDLSPTCLGGVCHLSSRRVGELRKRPMVAFK